LPKIDFIEKDYLTQMGNITNFKNNFTKSFYKSTQTKKKIDENKFDDRIVDLNNS
jgi:hypothetical protein